MQSEDRGEEAKLNPSNHQLVILHDQRNLHIVWMTTYGNAVMMSTNVMGPPAVTDIGRRSGKLWLESKYTPQDLGILIISIEDDSANVTLTPENPIGYL